MGVHGLTTFLRENRRALSQTRVFSSSFSDDRYTPLVVDGWSLIYILYADSSLPWVYGGEYDAFSKFVQGIVKAWLSVGLEPYFVFDGPVPLAKVQTTIKRLTEVVRNANVFFRTSSTARSAPSFLASNRIVPPLLFETCLDALRELQEDGTRVHVVMADEEADPVCVSLAAALGNGLVVAIDSDFAVLHSEGYGGYVPTDEMVWQTTGGEDSTPQTSEDLDGFQAVVSKPRTRRKTSGLIPPTFNSDNQELSLTLAIYHPHTLAAHLQLPPALLPLFSALVGNDFSNPTHMRKFFENRSPVIERIWKVARAVSSAVKTKTQGQGKGDAVLDVIHAAVMKLLVRPDMFSSGEVDKIVDETVDAALECTIPPASNLPISLLPGSCASHPNDECPLTLRLGESSSKLLRAYYTGGFSPRLMNAVTTGIVLPKTFLEDPDQRTCANVTAGTWSWIWAILAAGGHVQLPSSNKSSNPTEIISPPAAIKSPFAGIKSPTDDDTDSRLDDSELISVVEDFTATEPSIYSDPTGLASELAERLKGLAGSWDDLEGTDTDLTEEGTKETLIQYARRGLKLVPEPVTLKKLDEMGLGGLKEAESWEREDRVRVFLEGMRSNTPMLRSALEASLSTLDVASTPTVEPAPPTSIGALLWICVLRCVVQASGETVKTGTGTGNLASVGKWRKAEARALLYALTTSPDPSLADATPPLDVRMIQRVAQVLHMFDAGARLDEATYLFDVEEDKDRVRRNIVGRAVRMFSGRWVHAYGTISTVKPDQDLWALVCEGVDEGVWAHETERGKAKVKAKSTPGKSPVKPVRSGGFGVLASLGTE